jgi:hypothetical protein
MAWLGSNSHAYPYSDCNKHVGTAPGRKLHALRGRVPVSECDKNVAERYLVRNIMTDTDATGPVGAEVTVV